MSYMVRVPGVPAGTTTTLGVVERVEQLSLDYYLVTFTSGQTRRFRYNQTLTVVE